MVKYGRKFFFDTNYIKKDKKLTVIIIITVILLIGTTFIITSFFNDKASFNPEKKVEVYEEITINIFEEFPSILTYFKTLENVKYGDIKITYPEQMNQKFDFSGCTNEQKEKIEKYMNGFTENSIEEEAKCLTYLAGKAGNYPIEFAIGKETYKSTLKVVDETAPVLITKNVEIFEDETYNAESFVEDCSDNSEEKCDIKFLNTSIVDYSIYKEPGEYQVKIVAYDNSNNQSEAQLANLTIKRIVYYTVAFNSNGGTAIDSVQVREGESVPFPKQTSRTNYNFLGWYNGNTEFDFNTPVTGDINLTAKWEKIQQQKPSGNGNGNGNGSGGGKTPTSGGGGGSKPSKESQKTYAEAIPNGDISIEHYKLIGGSKNDNMSSSIDGSEASKLANQYVDQALKYYKNIAEDATYTFVDIKIEQVYDDSYQYLYGWLIKYHICSCDSSCGGSCNNAFGSEDFTLYCTSKTNCSIY